MKIWAIGDLHLGFSTGKWMDIFGEHWRDHHRRVEAAWRDLVGPTDIVLVPGDLSWAMKPLEVEPDLRWLAGLPGAKVLVKGNHDYWWPGTQAKLRALLPPGLHALKKTAAVIQGVPFIGVRGADFWLRNGEAPPEVNDRLVRERRELLQSLEHLSQLQATTRGCICLFHYPPFPVGRSESAFTRILEDVGCRHCVFGHLHTPTEWERVFREERGGVSYHLVSADFLGFRPVLIDEVR